jgi:hypothetical protein
VKWKKENLRKLGRKKDSNFLSQYSRLSYFFFRKQKLKKKKAKKYIFVLFLSVFPSQIFPDPKNIESKKTKRRN